MPNHPDFRREIARKRECTGSRVGVGHSPRVKRIEREIHEVEDIIATKPDFFRAYSQSRYMYEAKVTTLNPVRDHVPSR